MAFEVKKVDGNYGVFNGYNSEFLRWQDLSLDTKGLHDYLSRKPFPKDPHYSLSNFLFDLKAEGPMIIPSPKRRTAEYICDLVSGLI